MKGMIKVTQTEKIVLDFYKEFNPTEAESALKRILLRRVI